MKVLGLRFADTLEMTILWNGPFRDSQQRPHCLPAKISFDFATRNAIIGDLNATQASMITSQ